MNYELILLEDVTGSKNYPVVKGSDTTRKAVSRTVVENFVARLSELDTKGATEAKGGGIHMWTFAMSDENPAGYTDMEDVNPGNFDEVWNSIVWGGGTYIMPCIRAALADYKHEFNADETKGLIMIDTDGALEDGPEFQDMLRHLPVNVNVEIIIGGEGSDNHGAYDAYKRIADASGGRVNVTSFQGKTDPNIITSHLLDLVKTKVLA